MLWRSVPKDILVSRSTQHLGGRKPFMHICSLLPTPQQLHTNVSIMGSTLGHCQGRLRPHQRARRARSPAMPPARYERALDAAWIQRWYMRSRKMRYLQNYLVPAPGEGMSTKLTCVGVRGTRWSGHVGPDWSVSPVGVLGSGKR